MPEKKKGIVHPPFPVFSFDDSKILLAQSVFLHDRLHGQDRVFPEILELPIIDAELFEVHLCMMLLHLV